MNTSAATRTFSRLRRGVTEMRPTIALSLSYNTRIGRNVKQKASQTYYSVRGNILAVRFLSPAGRLRIATGASPWTLHSLIRSPSGANETFNRPAGVLCLETGVPWACARG